MPRFSSSNSVRNACSTVHRVSTKTFLTLSSSSSRILLSQSTCDTITITSRRKYWNMIHPAVSSTSSNTSTNIPLSLRLLSSSSSQAETSDDEKSSSSNPSYALNYLENWVGTNNTTTTTNKPNTNTKSTIHKHSSLSNASNASQINNNNNNNNINNNINNNNTQSLQNLQVTGQSYLLPTLRFERNETPTTLSTKLESFFTKTSGNSASSHTPAAIRALLLPKKTNHQQQHHHQHQQHQQRSSSVYRVAIILDLKAFQHDGSPHYKPPSSGSLQGFVHVLSRWGITVIGVTNLPIVTTNNTNTNGDTLGTTMEEEAVELGLPVLMPRVGRSLGGTSGKQGLSSNQLSSTTSTSTGTSTGTGTGSSTDSNTVGVDQLVHIVMKKMESLHINHDDDDDDQDNEDNITNETTPPPPQEEETNVTSNMNDDIKRKVPHVGGYPQGEEKLSITDVKEMSYRTMQERCKDFELKASGTSEALRERIIEYIIKFPPYDETKDHHSLLSTTNDDENDSNQQSFNNEVVSVDSNGESITDTPESLSSSSTTTTTTTTTMNATPMPPVDAKVYHGSVRTGQQISTDKPNQSLIITGNVNSGGEVMADGDLFIFGKLRGRAFAGLSMSYNNDESLSDGVAGGAQQAKIFANSFDAELICIGDSSTTIDNVQDLGLKEDCGVIVSVEDGSFVYKGF